MTWIVNQTMWCDNQNGQKNAKHIKTTHLPIYWGQRFLRNSVRRYSNKWRTDFLMLPPYLDFVPHFDRFKWQKSKLWRWQIPWIQNALWEHVPLLQAWRFLPILKKGKCTTWSLRVPLQEIAQWETPPDFGTAPRQVAWMTKKGRDVQNISINEFEFPKQINAFSRVELLNLITGCSCKYRYGGVELESQEFPPWPGLAEGPSCLRMGI